MQRLRPSWARYLGVAMVLAFVPRTAVSQAADHQYSSSDIAAGSRVYASQCALCHGNNGNQVQGIDLRRGVFRTAVNDEDIRRVVTNGVTTAGMPPFSLQPAELDWLVAYIRAGFDPAGTAVRIGDMARGKTVYEGKGQCASCHRVNGVGSRSAPDLSDIGALRRASAIQKSLVDPSGGMLPINRPVRIVTADGRTFRGRRLNEDTYVVQIIDDQERLLSFDKPSLREFEVGLTSPMPSVTGRLSSEEIADLTAYLVSLRGL